ncbi:MAG TPA: peptidase, partial [Arenimonas sp.]|nr:peptidase [Arenimonas sp.]
MSLSAAIALSLTACKKDESTMATTETKSDTADLAIDFTKLPPLPAFNVADVDVNASACVDLNAYVNGKWLAANPVPGDRTTWGSFEMLGERSLATQRQIVEAAAALKAADGTKKLIGDLWATGMDEAAIEAAGITPIKPFLDEIDTLKSPADLPGYLRKSASEGRMTLFGIGGESDFKDSSKVIAYAAPGGLGLPDKTYYEGDAHKAEREAYQAHIAATLKLAGADEAAATKQAATVLAIETALAKVSYSSEELSRDVSKYYNPVTIADANKITPAFEWGAYFKANTITAPEQFSLSNPNFFKTLDGMFASVPMDDWKAYLRFHTVDGLAPYLSKAFVDQNFAFYGKTLRGQLEQKDRWKRVLDTVNGTAGEALGQLYVDVAFPAENKAQMEKLVANLSAALKTRLENLAWMSPETRTKALEKWSSFTPKIGYPDKWRSWNGLDTSRDSYVGNITAAAKFNHAYQMAKIGKPKDRTEWGMSPQTVNAYYNPLMNEIVFPAAIL